MMKTWKQLITREMEIYGEGWLDMIDTRIATYDEFKEDRVEWEIEIVRKTFFEYKQGGWQWKPNWYDLEFDSGYGNIGGIPFILWTQKRVYFPAVYDGLEWVESVPRDPTTEVIPYHRGGG